MFWTGRNELFEETIGKLEGWLAEEGYVGSPDLDVHREFQVEVWVVLPLFRFDGPKTYHENSRNAAVAFEAESRDGIHIENTKSVDGRWRAAGESGMPLVVTGTGKTLQEARTACCERLDAVAIPDRYYGDDIGERWIEGDGNRLQAWGYLGPEGGER